jgi:hypothetical protein
MVEVLVGGPSKQRGGRGERGRAGDNREDIGTQPLYASDTRERVRGMFAPD